MPTSIDPCRSPVSPFDKTCTIHANLPKACRKSFLQRNRGQYSFISSIHHTSNDRLWGMPAWWMHKSDRLSAKECELRMCCCHKLVKLHKLWWQGCIYVYTYILLREQGLAIEIWPLCGHYVSQRLSDQICKTFSNRKSPRNHLPPGHDICAQILANAYGSSSAE